MDKNDVKPGCEREQDIEEVIHVIVNNFDGDTLAFHESIRERAPKFQELDILEAALARKFAKIG